MIIYFVLMVCSVMPSMIFNINKNSKTKKMYLVFIFSLIAIISSFRNITVGNDTHAYYYNYMLTGNMEWGVLFEARFEPGYFILCKILNYMSPNPLLLFLLVGCFISIAFAIHIYRNSTDVILSTFIFLCMFFNSTMNVMRQYLAFSIVLLGIELLKGKKYIWYCIISVIASLFHSSALVCLLYIVFIHYKYKRFHILLYIFIGTISFYSYFHIRHILQRIVDIIPTFNVFSRFFDSSHHFDGSIVGVFWLKIIMALLLLIFYIFVSNDKSNEEFSFSISNIIAWLVSQMITTIMSFVSRLTTYFEFIILTALPNSLERLKNGNSRVRIILTVLVYLFFLLYFINAGRSIANGTYDYSFITSLRL